MYVLTNEEHWTLTPETHKYAAVARSFCFATTENGKQQDISSLITLPFAQRSLYLNEVTNDFCLMDCAKCMFEWCMHDLFLKATLRHGCVHENDQVCTTTEDEGTCVHCDRMKQIRDVM